MKKFIINKKQILKNNKKINSNQLEEVNDLIKELRKNGIKPDDYNIVSPYTKRLKFYSETEDNISIHF